MSKIFAVKSFGNDDLDQTPMLLLEIDSATAQNYLKKIALVQQLKKDQKTEGDGMSLHRVSYWNYSGEYLDLYSLDESVDGVTKLQEDIDTREIVEIEKDSELHKYLQGACEADGTEVRTECETMDVHPDGVYFIAYVKHTSCRFDSNRIKKGVLEKIV